MNSSVSCYKIYQSPKLIQAMRSTSGGAGFFGSVDDSRAIGGLWLLSAQWSGCCLFDIFPLSLLNFNEFSYFSISYFLLQILTTSVILLEKPTKRLCYLLWVKKHIVKSTSNLFRFDHDYKITKVTLGCPIYILQNLF